MSKKSKIQSPYDRKQNSVLGREHLEVNAQRDDNTNLTQCVDQQTAASFALHEQ